MPIALKEWAVTVRALAEGKPDAAAAAEPLLPPLQLAALVLTDTTMALGCVNTTHKLIVHPPASVTVTVWLPAPMPLRFWVVCPPVHI
mgnify:CR=1 FL=1